MPAQPTETTRPWTFDAKTGVVYGLTTAAWYTVPDIAQRRGTRALLKTACGIAGMAVLLRTDEGREAVEGLRSLKEKIRDGGVDSAEEASIWAAENDEVPDNPVHDLTPVEISPAGKATIAAGAVVALGITTALAVAGEKAAYRWGERMRARGVRAPHLRVGLAIGAATVLLGGLNPAAEDD
ncbi:hypothetical protein [Oerskovia turbata]